VTITVVDELSVQGTVSGLAPLNINDLWVDVNGSFNAVRCTADEWLDTVRFDPNDGPEGGFDPACLLPEPH
jgi:hypothetical protein